MPIDFTWHDTDKTILLCALTGAFTVESYGQLQGKLPMSVRERAVRVDAILYLKRGAKLPDRRSLLRELAILTQVMPPNFGLFVGVGDGWLLNNPLSVVIAEQFLHRYYPAHLRGRIRAAGSLPDAAQIIATSRQRRFPF